VGEQLLRRPDFTRRVLRSGWGDRDTWDEEAAETYAAVQRQPQTARAGSLMYRTFLARELGPIAASGFDGRLGVPTRLVIGRRDPLGAHLADGVERHGDDARAEILEGCGHRRRGRPGAREQRARVIPPPPAQAATAVKRSRASSRVIFRLPQRVASA
jgi:pimeloyl-ACP methyl ester carboxylesterase